jgi:radical SAM-linked protein
MRIRITFSKQGALRYTGHLDLHNLWERAARRAALPLAYSQGFHPQPKIQIAAALPLGFSSRAELMDIWLKEDRDLAGLRDDLQSMLPSGIQILAMEQVDERSPALQTQVVSADYEVTIPSKHASGLDGKVAALLDAESMPRERRGKQYDLRPLIESISLTPIPTAESGSMALLRLAAREGATGRPEEVLAALGIPAEETRIERTALIFRG